MKHYLVICLCIISLLSYSQQDSEETRYPETVIVKLQETYAPGLATPVGARTVTIDIYDKIESQELERSNIVNGGKEEIEANLKKFRQELQKWQNLGYAIKGTTAASPLTGVMITIIILQKN